jgi:hypothetical protein
VGAIKENIRWNKQFIKEDTYIQYVRRNERAVVQGNTRVYKFEKRRHKTTKLVSSPGSSGGGALEKKLYAKK